VSRCPTRFINATKSDSKSLRPLSPFARSLLRLVRSNQCISPVLPHDLLRLFQFSQSGLTICRGWWSRTSTASRLPARAESDELPYAFALTGFQLRCGLVQREPWGFADPTHSATFTRWRFAPRQPFHDAHPRGSPSPSLRFVIAPPPRRGRRLPEAREQPQVSATDSSSTSSRLLGRPQPIAGSRKGAGPLTVPSLVGLHSADEPPAVFVFPAPVGPTIANHSRCGHVYA